MNSYRCPGQDKRFWRPEDIFDADCPFCGKRIEFWKDDPRITCERCGNDVPNPRLNLNCVAWCKFAEQCLGIKSEEALRSPEQCARASADSSDKHVKGDEE